jgi:hypothetical protein
MIHFNRHPTLTKESIVDFEVGLQVASPATGTISTREEPAKFHWCEDCQARLEMDLSKKDDYKSYWD